MWSYVIFCPKEGVALSPLEAKRILSFSEGEKYVTLAGKPSSITVTCDFIVAEGVRIPTEVLRNVAKLPGDTLVFIDSEHLEVIRLAFRRSGKFYKLRFLGEGVPPTLEISGIHMHNIVGTDPWRDSGRKVKLARVRSGMRVLDICTGLGYTAIHSMQKGAQVVSVEKDPAVIEIAEYNPWSKRLTSPNIILLLGDAYEVLDDLPSGFFDAAIHDPPCFSLAGELYSEEFYRKLKRVMRNGALVFHYTGSPGKHRGINIQAGVARRMRRAGFSIVKVLKGYGLVARA